MADTPFYGNLVNYLVWPSEADHHGDEYGTGAGLIMYEPVVAKHWHAHGMQRNAVISGFTLPAIGEGTLDSGVIDAVIDIGAETESRAVINGYQILGTDDIAIELTPSTTQYIYLQLAIDPATNKVTHPFINVCDSYKVSTATDLYLGGITCDASDITATNIRQVRNRIVWGSISAASTKSDYGSNDWTVSGTTITFSTAFPKVPTIIVAPLGTASYYFTAQVTEKSASAFTAIAGYFDAGSWTGSAAFEFVAFG